MLLHFELQNLDSTVPAEVVIDEFVVAGWAGKNIEAIEHHIKELEAIGVPRPSAVPLFYRVASNQLIQKAQIEVVGSNTSGEVEPLVFGYQGELYISIGSDHTDRTLETHSVALSKQICAKPVGQTAWKFADVRDHLDDIILRSWIETDAGDVLYQEGRAGSLRSPEDLLATYLSGRNQLEALAMSCGTMAVIGDIRPAENFRIELIDEKLGRKIVHRYATHTLAEVA